MLDAIFNDSIIYLKNKNPYPKPGTTWDEILQNIVKLRIICT